MRKLLIVLAVLAALIVIAFAGGRAYLRRSVAQYDGTVQTKVAAPVEITFDARGVPQIWAKTDSDAFFAVGWLHASERLFQMELVRRVARGELAEVFGEVALDNDTFQRRIGFARNAKAGALTPAARAASQRYVDGVNAWIAQARVLPPEFVLLRLTPRPWTIEDCLAVSNYQTWYSHELMDQDRKYQALIEKLGMPAKALAHAGHPWSPPTVPDLSISKASNSWAIAPSRSSTGAALHASDPHLAIDQVPGLWYLAGIHSEEGLDVVGVTYAGGPFVVMGHNRDIAFSFTVASVDVIDYYDDAPLATIAREEIRVKGEEKPRVVEVKRGARGVMLDDKTSLHWAGFDFDPAAIADAGLRLQKAKNFDDFRRAVTGFGALDANWIYSDRAGNIGYQLGAPIPVRDYDSYMRQSASNPGTTWRGYRALDETPHALNPAQGFLASSNNQIVSRDFAYAIPGFYDPYRITRAAALLGGDAVWTGRPRLAAGGGTREQAVTPARHDAASMRAVQLDVVSGIALRWKSLAGLENWNGAMSPDSKDATLFAAWWRRMPKAVFEDELGADWDLGRSLLDEALTTGVAIDDKRTPKVETLQDISARAMKEAREIANGRTWGEACTLLVRHPLSRVKVLRFLNRGPFPGWGDAGTLNANFYSYHDDSKSFRAHVGASMRFVLDWSDVDSFTLTGALGQSGNPFSAHYDDFLPMMLRGEPWNVPFTREKVFARKTSQLTLTPESSGTAR